MAATLSALDKILKEFYLPPVVEQLNNDILFAKRLDTDSNSLYGRRAIVPLHTGRSGGIGARGEMETLPTPDVQKYDEAIYTLKYLYGAVQASGPAMELTSSNEGAFLEAFKSELDGIRNDLARDTSRQLYGDGSAKLATCGTTTADTAVVISSDEPLRKGQIYPGLLVDIGTAAAPTTVVAAASVVSVDIATKTVTIDSAVTTSSSDFIFIAGANVGGTVREITGGVQALVPTTPGGTYGTIDSSTSTFWQNQALAATAGAVALDDLATADNMVTIKGGRTSAMVSSLAVQRKYFNLLQSQVQFVEPMKLVSGFRTLEFNDRPFIADRDCPFGNVYLLDERYIKIFSNRDWHFLDRDGEQIKWVQNKDGWQAFLCRYMEMGATKRDVHLVYHSITDATGV
jgi:hypothetical protein